jgi:predicted aldo/keto reductase-like oxidoreductase
LAGVATAGAVAAAGVPQVAGAQGASLPAGGIAQRAFGRHADVKVAILGLGGHHLGNAGSAAEAAQILHTAVDGGMQYMDNAWEYNDHRSEEWMGRALAQGGYRDKVFLMTKVCTHGRDASVGMRQLEESLKRLRTDRLDLWQIHAVTFDNDPDLAYRKNGVLEALLKAKQQGKVRFVGFTGHKDPNLHKRMIDLGFPFDAVQMPINPFDAQFRSFQRIVVPLAQAKGMAVIGMKPFSGRGDPFHAADVKLTPQEALRYAMSVPGVTITVTGMESLDVVKQNLAIARGFTPMTADEMARVVANVQPQAGDGRLELYKTSIQYDDTVTRQVHEFPLAGATA